MDHFKQLETFVAVATCGNLSAAVAAEGVAPAVTGRHIDALEERLGVKLLVRTTRRIILTSEGSAFLEDCQRILNDLYNAETSVSAGGVKTSGHLRATASAGFGRRHVAPMAPDFVKTHPDVSMTLGLGGRAVDLVNEGFDCAIHLGNLPDPSLVSVRLWEDRRVVVAAPSYLERRGVPTQMEQLSMHNCLTSGTSANVQRGWVFQQSGKAVTIKASDTMECTDGAVLREWRLQGYGLVWRSWWEIGHDIATGKLVTVLDAFEAPPISIHAVFPQRKHLPLRVRLFIDFLKNMYGNPAYWRRVDALIGMDQQSPRVGEMPHVAYNQDKNVFPHPTSGGRMFQHVPIPTGGSELSRKAVAGALDFAKTLGARLTTYTCLKEYPYTPFSEIVVETPQAFKERVEAQAHVVLKDVEDAAVSAGIRCDTDTSCFAVPYMGIIDAAERHGCDVIFVASYGRRGLAGLLLSSETQKVLTHTEIPVIVYR